jgi:hypothetical protein
MKARRAPDYYRRVDRVASVMRVIDKLATDHLKPEKVRAEIEMVSHARPVQTWLFAIAAAGGAAALSVILGARHFAAAALIAGSAGKGALVLPRPGARLFDAISSRLKT